MEQDYIEPGVYRDEQGTTVDVSKAPNGRYEVDYGDGIKNVFSAATIRKCYPIAVVVAALALLPAVAFGATGHVAAAKRFAVAYGQAHNWNSLLGAWTVTCKQEAGRPVYVCDVGANDGSLILARQGDTFHVAQVDVHNPQGV